MIYEGKNMYTIDDIDVFIMTHNRSELITQTLNSCIIQSVRLNNITVLDNESEDDTEEVVSKYQKHNVHYVKTFGKYGNFLKAQELVAKSNAKYVMTFHDDDLLHPEFFEKILLILNSTTEPPALLMSSFSWFPVSGIYCNIPIEREKELPSAYLSPSPLSNNAIMIHNSKEMVNLILAVENPPYPQINPCICSAIYRKDLFLKRVPMNDVYGKIDDIPLMIDLASKGNVIILADNNAVFHRTHRNRDAYNDETGNTLEQSLNWIKAFTQNIDTADKDSYKKLLSMVSYLYPIISAKKTLKEYPTNKVIEIMISKKIAPEYIKKIYRPNIRNKPVAEFLTIKEAIDVYSPHSSSKQKDKKISFIEKIFSLRNEIRKNGKQRKVLYLLGLKIRLYKKGKSHA